MFMTGMGAMANFTNGVIHNNQTAMANIENIHHHNALESLGAQNLNEMQRHNVAMEMTYQPDIVNVDYNSITNINETVQNTQNTSIVQQQQMMSNVYSIYN